MSHKVNLLASVVPTLGEQRAQDLRDIRTIEETRLIMPMATGFEARFLAKLSEDIRQGNIRSRSVLDALERSVSAVGNRSTMTR
jgi:uncharacterized LabA/DUF88 family protein